MFINPQCFIINPSALIQGGYQSLFMKPLISLFWTSGDVSPGLQKLKQWGL